MTDTGGSHRERRVWRLLVVIQVAAVATVLVAILIVWVVADTGAEFASR